MNRKCTACKRNKPLRFFAKQKQGSLGRTSQCRPCVRKKMQAWSREFYHLAWAHSTILNHRRVGVIFRFTAHELAKLAEQTHCCDICQRNLSWQPGKMDDLSPTVDRITNRSGKIRLQGIQILCAECNRTKGSRSMSQFVDFCKMVAGKYS